jgi:hypothetical protein
MSPWPDPLPGDFDQELGGLDPADVEVATASSDRRLVLQFTLHGTGRSRVALLDNFVSSLYAAWRRRFGSRNHAEGSRPSVVKAIGWLLGFRLVEREVDKAIWRCPIWLPLPIVKPVAEVLGEAMRYDPGFASVHRGRGRAMAASRLIRLDWEMR